MSPNETKIFINYAREDASFAQRLYFDLKQWGYNVWLDTSDLRAGENWKQAIQRAIKQSNFIISLLSSNSITKKGYVQKELKICFEILDEFPSGSIYIIPVRLNDCEVIEEKIKKLNWVDIFESYSEGLYRILKSLSPDFAPSFSEVRDLLYKPNKRSEIRLDGDYVKRQNELNDAEARARFLREEIAEEKIRIRIEALKQQVDGKERFVSKLGRMWYKFRASASKEVWATNWFLTDLKGNYITDKLTYEGHPCKPAWSVGAYYCETEQIAIDCWERENNRVK